MKKSYDEKFKKDVQEQDKILKETLADLKETLQEIAEETGENLDEIYEHIIEWIASRDPVRLLVVE